MVGVVDCRVCAWLMCGVELLQLCKTSYMSSEKRQAHALMVFHVCHSVSECCDDGMKDLASDFFFFCFQQTMLALESERQWKLAQRMLTQHLTSPNETISLLGGANFCVSLAVGRLLQTSKRIIETYFDTFNSCLEVLQQFLLEIIFQQSFPLK